MPYDNKKKKKAKKTSWFGGLLGEAEKALRERQAKLDKAIEEASTGKKAEKKKKKKKKAKDKRNTQTYR